MTKAHAFGAWSITAITFFTKDTKGVTITGVVAELRATSTKEAHEILKASMGFVNQLLISMNERAVVIELVKMVLESLDVLVEGELSLDDKAIIGTINESSTINNWWRWKDLRGEMIRRSFQHMGDQ